MLLLNMIHVCIDIFRADKSIKHSDQISKNRTCIVGMISIYAGFSSSCAPQTFFIFILTSFSLSHSHVPQWPVFNALEILKVLYSLQISLLVPRYNLNLSDKHFRYSFLLINSILSLNNAVHIQVIALESLLHTFKHSDILILIMFLRDSK